MNETEQLLAECKALDVRLRNRGGELAIDAPKAALTPELIDRLKSHKGELLSVLNRSPKPSAPFSDFGPGTELREILNSLGISELPGCGCKNKMRRMNRWGVEGCREHFDEIVGWMREGYEKAKKIDKIKASVRATASPLAFKLNPLDPFPSLVREAIRRAEEKATGESCPA